MQELYYQIDINEIIEEFDNGQSTISIQFLSDATYSILPGNYILDESIKIEILEAGDFESFANKNEYKRWLNDCFYQPIELDDYILNVKFVK